MFLSNKIFNHLANSLLIELNKHRNQNYFMFVPNTHMNPCQIFIHFENSVRGYFVPAYQRKSRKQNDATTASSSQSRVPNFLKKMFVDRHSRTIQLFSKTVPGRRLSLPNVDPYKHLNTVPALECSHKK